MIIKSNHYELTAALFLRLLSVIFFAAFLSLGQQIVGLVGSDGILPLEPLLDARSDHYGISAWWRYPTLFWIYTSDNTLMFSCYVGCLLSVLLFFNVFPRTCLIIILLLYLSLYHAGQIFMNFQWDILLLECGFLALFLSKHSRYIIWLFRWLLFRLRFLSGISKLTSQDPTWSGLTAIIYYFEVQPLPNSLSWYAHQLPDSILIGAAVITLFVEILVPLMMFLPRPYRHFAAWVTIIMQIIIMCTSNHNWFNLLTLTLCLFLFDDHALKRVLPNRICTWLVTKPLPVQQSTRSYQITMPTLAFCILFISSIQIYEMLSTSKVSGPLGELNQFVKPFALVNKYHVFPTMRTERYELVIYGTQDGVNWKAYEFNYKPGNPALTPEIIIPHHPRLDWLMWFVTLHPHFMSFFEAFIGSLLEGSPSVIKLLKHNPFPDTPPDMIRVDLYRYSFTNFDQRKKTGNWWQRDYLGQFPPLPYANRADFNIDESKVPMNKM